MNARRSERGMALVTSVVLITIMAALGAVMLTNGARSDRSSARGRNWTEALHVAEAGAQQAIAYLQAANGATPAPFAGTVAEGGYDVTVTNLGRNRYQIDSTGTSGSGAGFEASRRIEVLMAPPRSFNYALFSMTDVNTKNNDLVTGDIWANGSVVVDQNDIVDGSVNAATGWIFLDNNSVVTGDLQSGGFGANGRAVDVSTGARVDGQVKASSTAPDCSDDPSHLNYQVNVVGSIGGTVTTWGTKTGPGSVGGLQAPICTSAPAMKTIPVFTYNPAHYSPAPMEFSSPSAFTAYLDAGNRTNLSGTFYVTGGSGADPIDLTGVEISGDTTIVAPSAPIDANGVGGANGADKLFVLVSYYQPPPGAACTDNGGNPADCAIGMKNNFEPGDNTATLLYAPNGPVAFKNNADFNGAVYANDIVLKNNQVITYDERVDQIVGFGPVTLEPRRWVELPA